MYTWVYREKERERALPTFPEFSRERAHSLGNLNEPIERENLEQLPSERERERERNRHTHVYLGKIQRESEGKIRIYLRVYKEREREREVGIFVLLRIRDIYTVTYFVRCYKLDEKRERKYGVGHE